MFNAICYFFLENLKGKKKSESVLVHLVKKTVERATEKRRMMEKRRMRRRENLLLHTMYVEIMSSLTIEG